MKCDYCGRQYYKEKCVVEKQKHHFCSRECVAKFYSKKYNPDHYLDLKDRSKMGDVFRRLNPILNKSRMTPEVKEKLRNARLGKGDGKTYTKTYGRHTHRVVAEQILGRPLRKGEVVHHIDGDKRNNDPSNIRVFESQAEHAKFHAELNEVLKMLNS